MKASALCAWMSLLCAGAASAQELEPRAYSPSPVGTTFVLAALTRSTGGVFTDPSLPITDVEATVGALGLGLGRVFGIAGKQASVLALVPIVRGRASGAIGEDRRSVDRTGLADLRFKFSMIVAGSPAMRPAEFAKSRRRPVIGGSVTVGAPAGQYDKTKLVNLGSNRWSFKPEFGVSVPVRRWTIDAYAGVWLFTDNDSFYPGASNRHQDPIVTLQGHLSYTFSRRGWIALDGTYYRGGTTTIDAIGKADLLSNSRLGATWAIPIGRRQSIKLSYSAGATTRVGSDFRTIGVAWQMLIF